MSSVSLFFHLGTFTVDLTNILFFSLCQFANDESSQFYLSGNYFTSLLKDISLTLNSKLAVIFLQPTKNTYSLSFGLYFFLFEKYFLSLATFKIIFSFCSLDYHQFLIALPRCDFICIYYFDCYILKSVISLISFKYFPGYYIFRYCFCPIFLFPYLGTPVADMLVFFTVFLLSSPALLIPRKGEVCDCVSCSWIFSK